MYRTKTCGELNIHNVEEVVELSGWIQKIRNLGGMIFIDLRDEFGITQIVINDEKMQQEAKEWNTESCIHIKGKVVERSSKNNKIPTGEIEVVASQVETLRPRRESQTGCCTSPIGCPAPRRRRSAKRTSPAARCRGLFCAAPSRRRAPCAPSAFCAGTRSERIFRFESGCGSPAFSPSPDSKRPCRS